jgi:hypothetical protein
VERHIHNFYSSLGKQESQFISVDFKKQLRPGEVYAVLLPPGNPEIGPDPDHLHVQMIPILMNLEVAPRVHTTYDPFTLTNQHDIHIPTSGGGDTTHAMAKVIVKFSRGKENTVDTGSVNESEP